jgi:hypothetical protein
MSMGERDYCNELLLRKKAHDIIGYASQVSYPLYSNGQLVCTHVVDFVVQNNDGTFEIHEFKGFVTQKWVLKRKMFEACYPNMKYKVINARPKYDKIRRA